MFNPFWCSTPFSVFIKHCLNSFCVPMHWVIDKSTSTPLGFIEREWSPKENLWISSEYHQQFVSGHCHKDIVCRQSMSSLARLCLFVVSPVNTFCNCKDCRNSAIQCDWFRRHRFWMQNFESFLKPSPKFGRCLCQTVCRVFTKYYLEVYFFMYFGVLSLESGLKDNGLKIESLY